MTLLNVALSIVPIIEVESRVMFAIKIAGLIVIMNLIGLTIFIIVGKRRQISQPGMADVSAD